MSEWPVLTVQELVDQGVLERPMDGNHGEIHPKTGDFLPSGIPFVMASDLKGGQVDFSGCAFISEKQARCLRKGFAKQGDVLLSHKATIGRTAIVQDNSHPFLVLTPQVTYYRVRDKGRLINSFLKYYFDSASFKKVFEAWAGAGSTRAYLGITDQRRLPIVLPAIETQLGIAKLIEPIDNKIGLNRRMNETLEGTARAIFKDWFVDFGPTRAKMEGRPPYLAPDLWALFPDRLDEEGKPEGWKVGSFGEEFQLTMGQSPPGKTYNSSGDGMPFFQGRTDFGERFPSRRIYCSAPTRLAGPDDTLVSVRAPVGDLNMAWEKCAIGRGVAAARHKAGYRGYTYYTLSSLRPALEAFDHEGTIFGAINKAQFVALQVAIPEADLIDAFEALVTSIDDRIRANVSESHTLVSARDLLLPNLVSGKVRISEAEKAVL